MTGDHKLDRIRHAAARAERRMRLGRLIAALPTAATLSLGATGIALAVRKVSPQLLPEVWALGLIAGCAGALVARLAYAYLRTLPPRSGALALDRHHALHGRITNALEFAEVAEPKRTALMGAAIDDAVASVKALSPRHAVRLALPPELAVSACVALGVAGLALLEVRVLAQSTSQVATSNLNALEMSPDDLELFRDAMEELQKGEHNPEVQAAIERFNELIEDIEAQRLTRDEAFRRMQELENELLKGAEADRKALDDALQDTARELEKSDLTDPVAKALKQNDLAAAEQEMNKLAEKLRDKKKKPSKAELEKLKQALDRAVQNKKKALEQLIEHRAEVKKQLLADKDKAKKEKPDAGKQDDEREKSLLRKKERQLERLNRDIQNKQRALRRLSRLDRDLAKAAADLMRDLGMSAEDIEQAAQDLDRLQQEQMSDKQKEELRRRLQELRELVRQQKQGGKELRKRMRDFMKRARGGRAGRGRMRPGQGQPGQGQPGQGKAGKQGQGQGEGKGQQPGGIGIGPGAGQGVPIDMPGGGGDGDQPGGDGSGRDGDSYGSGSGGDPKGDSTDMKGDTVDVRAEGLDSNQGPTNAEVILSASRRGFTGKSYKKVYKQYRTVAEDQIDQEKIPDGMRFYVRRYFQLIRPRE